VTTGRLQSGRVRAVLFDLGETLLDETRMWDSWADRLGVPRFTFHALAGAAIERGDHPSTVVALLGGSLDDPPGDERFEVRDLYPDAVPALAELRSSGLLVAVGGNQPIAREAQVRAMGLPIDLVVSSASLGVEKPSPEFFRRAAGALDVDPAELLSVGDRLDNDIVPARAAGCRTAMVRRGPWGIRDAARPEASDADLVLESLTGLSGAIGDL
jgi:FMN phosphatase YigB (HAD superfamily)